MKNTDIKWYVIRCVSSQERKAKKRIETELKIQNLDSQVLNLLIPSKKENYIRKGKKVSREVNFFPGYILIQSELGPDIQHIIKNTNGVINILGGKDNPSPLHENEVLDMLGKIDESRSKSTDAIDFILGESVVITDGPFENFNGTIEEINRDKKRLKLAVMIFGRKTPIEMEYNQVIRRP